MFKLLHIDTETTPLIAYSFTLHEPHLQPEHIIKPSRLLCFSAKWHGEKGMIFHGDWKESHDNMVRAAHALLCEADAVCHYNGLSFDIPVLNREFLTLKLSPPSPSVQIDLFQTVKHKFRMDSSKLAHVAPFLKIGAKVKHQGFDLWRGCMEGDKKCLALMEKYNKEDTALVEKLYTAILPWISNHPNVGMHGVLDPTLPSCPSCGEHALMHQGYRRGTVYTYKRLQCRSCGAWCQERQSIRSAMKPLVKGI